MGRYFTTQEDSFSLGSNQQSEQQCAGLLTELTKHWTALYWHEALLQHWVRQAACLKEVPSRRSSGEEQENGDEVEIQTPSFLDHHGENTLSIRH